jgi:hypothetical protein
LAAASASRDVPQQHDEFVAADARDDVGGAHVANKRRGDRLEHRVAGGVAVAIVDRLEVVEIEIDQRRARAVTLDVSERALEFALEAAAVERLGERIDVDPRLELANAGARSFEFAGKPLDLGGKLIASARRRGFVVFGSSMPPRLFIGWRSEADRRGRSAAACLAIVPVVVSRAPPRIGREA